MRQPWAAVTPITQTPSCHYIDVSGNIDQILDYMKVLGTCLEYYKEQQNMKCNTCNADFVANATVMGIELCCKCKNSTKIGYEDIILNSSIKAMMIYYLVGTIEQNKNTIQAKFCSKQLTDSFQFSVQCSSKTKMIQTFSEEMSVRIQQYLHYVNNIRQDDPIYIAIILKDDSLVFLDKLVCQQNRIILVNYDNESLNDPEHKDITTLFFQSKISVEY